MANPEWGTKRICQSCATKFYDMKRDRIICPKCQTEYDPEAFLKTRRSRGPVAADKETIPAVVAGVDPDLELVDPEVLGEDEDGDVPGADGDDEDEDLIEDASELGEDEDDMAEVIENVDEEEER